MNIFKSRAMRSIALIFIATGSMTISTSSADAALFGSSSDYIVKINPSALGAIESAVKSSGGQIGKRFQYAFDGFVVKLPDALLPVLKRIPNILTVEKDGAVDGLAIQQNQTPTPSWGLDRVDQRIAVPTTAGYQGTYGYRSAGAGTTIYIGDTGIYPHADLAGRISSNGYSGIADGNGTVDCNGHGTHVSTTAAGTKYGLAKNARVVPVRILDCTGRGSYSGVIAGLDWILSPLNTNPKTQAVLNLSIGGPASTSLNDAILKLTNAGITVVAAAGNDGADACNTSPASARSAITVGATTIGDARAGFSNWGQCVDINAPGVGITGGWINGAESTNTISGTSMASPHVTGAAAIYLGLNPGASVAQVAEGLLAQSTPDVIAGLIAPTPNKFLYISPTDGGPVIVTPAVQVKTVSRVSHEDADVVVEVNPGNASTTATFEYSLDQTFSTGVKSVNLTPTPLLGGDLISLPIVIETLTASSTYYFRATASNESGSFTTPIGTFKTLAPPVKAPLPVATAPILVTGWSAKLTGTVNAMNGSTNVVFVYGTDPNFVENTKTGAAAPAIVSGSTNTPIALDISFLNGSTTYYYKVVAGNSVASVESNVISFTTAAVEGVMATVETVRPTGGLNTPATTITGRINPQGQTTTIRLVYGAEQSLTAYPKIITLPQQYTGIETVTVTADMVGLVPGYRYYYRFEAINAAGHTKITPLTNVGNPVMPQVITTTSSNITMNSLQLNALVNAGAGNLRFYFIYGTDPKLETGTVTVAATPFAITNAINNPITAAIANLTPATAYYFRVKMLAYTGPLAEAGGIAYGPVVKVETAYPPRLAQTITFTLPTTRYYGGADTVLNATSSSGLPVTYSVNQPNVCQIKVVDSQTVLTFTEPISAAISSSCGIQARQDGDYTYSPAQTILRTITFVKDVTTISAAWAGPLNETGTALNILVTSSSQPGLNENISGTTPMTVTSMTPTICRVDEAIFEGSSTAHTRATVRSLWNGTCQLSITFAGFKYWQARTITWSTPVTGMKTPQPGANALNVISFSTPANKEVGGTNPLIITTNSGLPVTVISKTPATCTIVANANGTYSAQSAAGLQGDNNPCTIEASQAGDDRWAPAVTQTRTFNWVRKFQTITFTLPTSRYFGGAPTLLTATSSSGLPVTYAVTTPSVCKVETIDTRTTLSYVTPLPVGSSATCIVLANQGGDSTYSPAVQLSRAMTWMKEATAAKVVLTSPITETGTTANIKFYSLNQTLLNESILGGDTATVISKTPTICSVSDAIFVGSEIAHTQVTIRGLWNGNCALQITFAGYSYWLGGVTGTLSTISGIKSPQSGANATQVITFYTPTNVPFGYINTLTAKATSTLPVLFTSLTPNICSVVTLPSGATAAVNVDGLTGDSNLCTIKAEQAGNGAWAPASPVTRSFNFIRKSQSLTFTLPSSRYMGGAPTNLVATSTSGLPVTFTTSTPNVCAITQGESTTTLSLVSVPTASSAICSVTATQVGNGTYAPAPSWVRTITWMKEPTAIKWNLSAPINVAGVSANINVYSSVQSSLAELNGGTTPLTVTSKTPTICKVTNPTYVGTSSVHTQITVSSLWNGTCQLAVAFAGNTYWLPSSTVLTASVTGMSTPQDGANAPQSILFNAIANREIGTVTPLVATVTSKLPITYTSLTPQSCVITEPTPGSYAVRAAQELASDGVTCSVQASQGGSSAWAPAASVVRTFTWIKAAMTLRLTAIAGTRIGAGPYLMTTSVAHTNIALNGGVSSLGLPVSVTTTTPALCQVISTTPIQNSTGTYMQASIRGLANGTCTVVWSFAGTAFQAPATLIYSYTITGVK